MNSRSLQGEKAILNFVEEMGIEVIRNDPQNELRIVNRYGRLRGDYCFDVRDCPNIVPTLAAMGSYVDGCFRITGGAITRLHKSPRIEAMVKELSRLGVNIKPLFNHDVYDGFEIYGSDSYREAVRCPVGVIIVFLCRYLLRPCAASRRIILMVMKM